MSRTSNVSRTHAPRVALVLGVVAALFSVTAPRPADAAGLLIADGGLGGRLAIEEHVVQVTVNNGIAITEVTQVFRNLEDRQVEALYTFPVPRHASVSGFSMWIGGKEMVGEVVEKKRAREIYNSYKERRRDPGLLEQVDYKRFEMRVFPIAARAEQKVQIIYYQELDHDHDWITYVYPLATETRSGADSRVRGTFGFTLDVKSEVPIVHMESPSHTKDFVFAPHSENYHQASLETRGGDLARDIVVAYRLSRPKTGFDIITSKEPGEDGFFCLMLTAGEDLEALDVGMDYVFVLDISGSMSAEGKLRLSRSSIAAFVDALGPKDRFEVITFNVKPTTLFNGMRDAADATKEEARVFLDSQQARGGTVLNSAVATAYRYGDPDRQLNVVILSDGMTQQRESTILMECIRRRPTNARVFCIGVGNEVNRPLLETVARQAGGLAAFISRGDDFDRQAKAFRRKLTRPAATSIRFAFDGARIEEVEPRKLPDLYHGSPVRLYGRYAKGGPVTVTVAAEVAGRAFEKEVKIELPDTDPANPEIERMWAWRRIDRLLKEADSAGNRDGVIDEIVALGELFSIVSEYTSFLVLENDAEFQRWKIERRNLKRIQRDRRSRQVLVKNFEALRRKAVDGLGPEAAARAPKEVARAPAPQTTTRARPQAVPTSPRPVPPTSAPPPRRTRSRSRGVDFDFGGSGPVGPIFAGVAAWLLRRKRRREQDAA